MLKIISTNHLNLYNYETDSTPLNKTKQRIKQQSKIKKTINQFIN